MDDTGVELINVNVTTIKIYSSVGLNNLHPVIGSEIKIYSSVRLHDPHPKIGEKSLLY